ncbi:hypothetical protein P7H12_10665 [Paenibacillus larvae]|nr:hypothetical protein [Paenibacillus larvae]MDT2263965.1 hypothetical protein [Paenibacillus larvae]
MDGWQTGNSTDDFDGDNRIAGKFIVFGGYALKAVEYGIEGLLRLGTDRQYEGRYPSRCRILR